MALKLKSWKFWVVIAACVIALSAGGFGVAKLVNYLTPIATPHNLAVVETASGAKYVMVDASPNAAKYEFVFSAAGADDVVLSSPSNVLDVTDLLAGYADFDIKARAIAEAGFGDSKFTETYAYVSKIKLAAPVLTLNEEQKRLYVALNESYAFEVNLTFELYYNGNLDGDALKTTTLAGVVTDNKHGAFLGYFDLSLLGAGEFQLGVRALPDDEVHFERSALALVQNEQ